jgi:LysR family cyn operon transcriptional activator
VPLFDRIGRRVRLTSEGEDLLRRARMLLADAASLAERARALGAGQTGILRVGATWPWVESLLGDFLALYRGRHPGVEVQLLEDGGHRLPERLARGDMHLALIPADERRFQGPLLRPNLLLAALPKTHRLSRRAVIDIVELRDEPLLVAGRGFASREWFNAACQAARIKPRVLLESATPHTLIALAATRYGVALMGSGVLVHRRDVSVIPLAHRGVPIGRWQMIAWDPDRFLPSYAKSFADELATYSRTHYPNRGPIRRAPPLPLPK